MVRSLHIDAFFGRNGTCPAQKLHEMLLPGGIEHIRAIHNLSYRRAFWISASPGNSSLKRLGGIDPLLWFRSYVVEVPHRIVPRLSYAGRVT